MTLPVAILAGGLATRLRPITDAIPKVLVDVAGRPFVWHQLEWLHKQGIRDVVLCVGYRGEQVEQAVGDGQQFGLVVQYSYDGDKLLGTGGALRKAMGKLGQTAIVLYGDSYLTCSLADIERAYLESGQPALMTVFRNEGHWDRSNVLFQDGRIVRYDKKNPSAEMQHIDYGVNVLSARALVAWKGAEDVFDLAELLSDLSRQGKLAGYEVTERFYEVGTHQGLRDMRRYLSGQSGGK
jgi:NDP-sugar pyrophosphorylase family protein